MIKRSLFFTLSFCLSFILLSLPIQGKKLFTHLDEVFSPLTARIFNQSETLIKKGGHIFKNADPPKEILNSEKEAMKKLLK